MKVYISHPIAGKTEGEKHRDEVDGRNYARSILGMDAVLPRAIEPACAQGYGDQSGEGCAIPGKVLPGDSHSVQCYMRGDIAEMLTCDAILVMPGWQASAGCRDEVNVAAMCGIPIHFFSTEDGFAGERV